MSRHSASMLAWTRLNARSRLGVLMRISKVSPGAVMKLGQCVRARKVLASVELREDMSMRTSGGSAVVHPHPERSWKSRAAGGGRKHRIYIADIGHDLEGMPNLLASSS